MKNGNAEYSTSELKLAALLLSEVSQAIFEVLPNGSLSKKLIRIIYPCEYQDDVNKLITEFIERRACVQVWQYNRNLNRLRDALKLDN